MPPEIIQRCLRVFPNPSGDFTFLSGNCTMKDQLFIQISDISGRKLQDILLVPEETRFSLKIDMKNWTRGVYVAEIRNSLETKMIKIIKN
jgi:hypothetical protein